MDKLQSFSEMVSLNSWLSVERKQTISQCLVDILPNFLDYRKQYIQSIVRTTDSTPSGNMQDPAWVSVSRTDSESGWRLMLGFKDQRCSYRNSDILGSGCFNCGFYTDTENSPRANTQSVLSQLQTALQYGLNSKHKFDVIEFLSDGSFLDDLSPKARESLLTEVARYPFIQRVLIESRPEGIYKNRLPLTKLLSILNGRTLEIATGLETADEFIRTVCIHKGFSKLEFEKGLEAIASVKKDTKSEIVYLSYILVKPAFLTTEESIIDAVKTIEYLNQIQHISGVKIIPKLEPATIPLGTLSTILYQEEISKPCHYSLLNYWAVLEILVRASESDLCKDIFSSIRIGERKDMGKNTFLPGVYIQERDQTPDPIDPILYHAIQDFNYHHNLEQIFHTIQGYDCSSLHRWLSEQEMSQRSVTLQKIETSQNFR
jgi:radical SAM enzyme (TIGR01210 family)